MPNMESISLDGGKYSVYFQTKPHEFKALRYGAEWRDLTGDNLIYAMFCRIIELEDRLAQHEDE